MKGINRVLTFVLIISLALLVYKNSKKEVNTVKTEPAKVESIEGSNLMRVTLTDLAAKRLGITTDTARLTKLTQGGSAQLVVPYSSLIYGLNGETWVYTNPEPLTFVRHRIEVDYIEEDLAVLIEGPEVGTKIVTVGVAELYGVETGIGK
mgnify:CR=1 FL=1